MVKRLLSKGAKNRAKGLLDMMYTPADIAYELQIDVRDIYRKLIPAGLPHEKRGGHIWIHGLTFKAWLLDFGQLKKDRKLQPDEGYCVRCRRAVKLHNPSLVKRGNLTSLMSVCPNCGQKVYRGVKVKHDQP